MYRTLVLLLLLSALNIAYAADTVVRIAPRDETNLTHTYFATLLKMAMDNTAEEFGGYQLVFGEELLLQSEAASHVRRKKNIDVIWLMTSKSMEQRLRPIRVPLFKGLLGHRVFAINKDKQPQFSRIQQIEELKLLTAGQGLDWPDTKILKTNGFMVVGVSNHVSIYNLLINDRLDYYPRSVVEVSGEIRKLAPEGVVIEDSILLRYKSPIYFFVHPDNDALHDRLLKGLNIAIANGSFDRHFVDYFEVKRLKQNLNLERRRIFDIPNPLLPKLTPVNVSEYWLDL